MISQLIAVIDIGSNTFHLLIGKVVDGRVTRSRDLSLPSQLGKEMHRSRAISIDDFDAGLEDVDRLVRIAREDQPDTIVLLATSAVRDASNGMEFVRQLELRCKIPVHVISGNKEATLGFQGAISELLLPCGQPVLTLDLGGGSAQVVQAKVGSTPDRMISLRMGCRLLTGRFCRSNPPTPIELEALRSAVREMLPPWEIAPGTEVVGIGGSARSLKHLTTDPLTVGRLAQFRDVFCAQPSAEVANQFGLTADRAQVLPAAVAIHQVFLETYHLSQFIVSPGGLREGAILAIAHEKEI